MAQETQVKKITLVSTSPRSDVHIERKRRDGDTVYYTFLSSEKHGGVDVCEVEQRDAFQLILATPHLFYPYYKGIDPGKHFRHTKRQAIRPPQVSKIFIDPEGTALGIIEKTDHSIRPGERPTRPTGGTSGGRTEFGPEEGLNESDLPPSAAEAGVLRDKQTQAPEAPQAPSLIESFPIPNTAEELTATHYDELRMTLSIHTGQKIGEITANKDSVMHALAQIAERKGTPIDGYVFVNSEEGAGN